MTNSIDNGQDIIDSRDVIARIEELQDDDSLSQDDANELKALLALAEQGEGYSDWQHGAALIRDSYFEEYARDLADDLGAIPDGASWPMTCIDWAKAARELRMDYTSINFDGVTYWVR